MVPFRSVIYLCNMFKKKHHAVLLNTITHYWPLLTTLNQLYIIYIIHEIHWNLPFSASQSVGNMAGTDPTKGKMASRHLRSPRWAWAWTSNSNSSIINGRSKSAHCWFYQVRLRSCSSFLTAKNLHISAYISSCSLSNLPFRGGYLSSCLKIGYPKKSCLNAHLSTPQLIRILQREYSLDMRACYKNTRHSIDVFMSDMYAFMNVWAWCM